MGKALSRLSRARNKNRDKANRTSTTKHHPARNHESTTMRNTSSAATLLLVALAALLVASASAASTRSLAQFANGIQSPSTLYIPGLGLSIRIGNVPGFYTDSIIGGLTGDDGPFSGASELLDYGVNGLLSSAVGNTVGVVNDVVNPGGSTITLG